jgi:transcriptional regulator with XRE-family HTH domain
MGYRGKVVEQARARELRAQAWTLNEIAAELGVSKSSVSLWVRDVPFDEAVRARRAGANRNRGAQSRRPSRLALDKQAEIEHLLAQGRVCVGELSERDFLVAGIALYAGKGAKADGVVKFANSDPRMIESFCAWLRRFFVVDESRLRIYLYLHAGLDLDGAVAFWSDLTGTPPRQFGRPYRAVPDPSIRKSKHPMGCPAVAYASASTHRAVMGLVHALLSCSSSLPG